MAKIKVCPKCGRMSCYGEGCKPCGLKLIETPYETQYCDYDPYAQQIYEEYVFNSPEYDEEMFKKRIEHDKEIEKLSHVPSRHSKQNAPVCPTYNSTNIGKILTSTIALILLITIIYVLISIISSPRPERTYTCARCDKTFTDSENTKSIAYSNFCVKCRDEVEFMIEMSKALGNQ